jgi:hypothetical protein
MNVLSLFDRPIAYHRCFVTITGSVTASVMLSQAFYWSKRTTIAGGWFWKTQEQWNDETGLSRYEQESARKNLRDLGIFEEKKKGIPAKLYFRLDTERLYELLEISTKDHRKDCEHKDVVFPHTELWKSNMQGNEEVAYSNVENQHYNTESTTETTTENKSTKVDLSAKKKPLAKKSKKQEQIDILLSFGIFGQIADDFLTTRSKPITVTAMNGNVRESAKAGISLLDAIQFATEKGWQAFTAEYYFNATKKSPSTLTGKNSGFNNQQRGDSARKYPTQTDFSQINYGVAGDLRDL